MSITQRLSERLANVSRISPATVNNASANGDYVDMSKFRRIVFILSVGATDTTVDFNVREATDGAGTGEQVIAEKAIVQLSATDDNKQVIIEVKAEEMSAGFTHLRPRVTVGNGATGAVISLIALAGDGRYEPAVEYDLASVAQIIA